VIDYSWCIPLAAYSTPSGRRMRLFPHLGGFLQLPLPIGPSAKAILRGPIFLSSHLRLLRTPTSIDRVPPHVFLTNQHHQGMAGWMPRSRQFPVSIPATTNSDLQHVGAAAKARSRGGRSAPYRLIPSQLLESEPDESDYTETRQNIPMRAQSTL